MKTHTKKKQFQAMKKQLAKDGYINLPDGRYTKRSGAVDNSMKRDFYPQEG